MSNTPHLSHSAIACFAQCGERYRLERIEHVPQAPAPALVLGVACHAAFEAAGRDLLSGTLARNMDLMPLQSAFLRAFSAELERADPSHVITCHEASLLAARGLAIVRAWYERVLPHFHPLAVEEAFEGALYEEKNAPDGYDVDDPMFHWAFTGRRDARTLAKQSDGREPLTTTLDWKSAEKPWTQDKAADAGMAQATAYAWGDLLDGRPISQQFTFVVMHTRVPEDWQPQGDEALPAPMELVDEDGITVEVNYWRLHPTVSDVRAYQRRAVATARAILAEQFTPNPSALCCWCQSYPHCESGKAWVRGQTKHQPLPVIQRFAEALHAEPVEASP